MVMLAHYDCLTHLLTWLSSICQTVVAVVPTVPTHIYSSHRLGVVALLPASLSGDILLRRPLGHRLQGRRRRLHRHLRRRVRRHLPGLQRTCWRGQCARWREPDRGDGRQFPLDRLRELELPTLEGPAAARHQGCCAQLIYSRWDARRQPSRLARGRRLYAALRRSELV